MTEYIVQGIVAILAIGISAGFLARRKRLEGKHKPEIDSLGNKKWRNKEGKYHREDGPAIQHKDGYKDWQINGRYHREDGAARMWPNGTKAWYLNGKLFHTELEWKKELNKPKCTTTDGLGNKYWKNKEQQYHREDGPAVEYANGEKYWYINGQIHREDGPAVEQSNGTKQWWLNGKYYGTEENWKKELNKPICTTNQNGDKTWRNKEGRLHREDGPAYEEATGTKQWIINGQFHREDGPACEYSNGAKTWWLNGNNYTEEDWLKELSKSKCETDESGHKRWFNKKGCLHREDGPAVEFANGGKQWIVNAQFHREDGPAIEYVNDYKEWWLNGKPYTEEEWKKALNEPKPDALGNKYWTNKEGRHHREDGPAIEFNDGYKAWHINGQYHREDGPARIWPDGRQEWYLNGKHYTEEDWKKELAKPKCTIESGTKNWRNKEGEFHREDGPAREHESGMKSWWINGKRHREDGPALIFETGTKGWYLNGVEYTEEQWKKELNKPTCEINENGTKKWTNEEGRLHRIDGPAFEDAVYKAWWINGKRHREDGPACEWVYGRKEWWLNDTSYHTEEDWKKAVEILKQDRESLNKLARS